MGYSKGREKACGRPVENKRKDKIVSSAIFSFVENYMMATVSAKISKNMRTDISKKINKLPLKYFDKTSYGDVISRVTNDVDAIGQTLNQSLDNLVKATLVVFPPRSSRFQQIHCRRDFNSSIVMTATSVTICRRTHARIGGV